MSRESPVGRSPEGEPCWRRCPLRQGAAATVTDPSGREFVVRVRRVFWPAYTRTSETSVEIVNTGAVGDVLDLVTGRFIWRVRVFGPRRRFRLRPLIYGEECRTRDAAVERARELADELAAGRRP